MVLLLSSTSFALELSTSSVEPGQTIGFSGTIPAYNECKNSQVDVRILLYHPVFGYEKISSSIFESNPDGSFDVSGSVKIPEYANG